MRGWVLLASLLGLPGCHVGLLGVLMTTHDQGPYLPETLAAELGPNSVRTVGCLDIGFAIFERDEKDLLDLHIGNRCAHPEALDIRRLTMRGTSEQGEARTVEVYDPRFEIGRFHVGGSEKGRERLRLRGARSLSRLCFDLENIAPDVPAARPAPLCFERNALEWKPSA